MAQPPHRGGKRGIVPGFLDGWNYPQATGTAPAQSLARSHSALGAYYRRMRGRLGGPQAITATAHKLARLIYSLLRYGTEYVDAGQHAYAQQYRDRVLSNLQRKAHAFGYKLIRVEEAPAMP
jgi:transposase